MIVGFDGFAVLNGTEEEFDQAIPKISLWLIRVRASEHYYTFARVCF